MSSSTENPTPTKKITLKTSDNENFVVDESVAYEFATVKTYFEDNSNNPSDAVMPLPNVAAKPLSNIIEFCKENLKIKAIAEEEKKKGEKKKFKEAFLKDKSNDDLVEMIPAANYLEIKDMLDVLNEEVADRIRNKSVEYVRRFFGIENDFTPEEEEKLRAENAWAFEGVDAD